MAPSPGPDAHGARSPTAMPEGDADLSTALEEALRRATLTAWQSLVLYLHYWLGWSFREIAEGCGLGEAAIRRDHRQALEALRETGLLDPFTSLPEYDDSRKGGAQ